MKDVVADYVNRVELNDRIADMEELTTQYWARKSKHMYDEAVETVEKHFPEVSEEFEDELSDQNYDQALDIIEDYDEKVLIE